MGRTPKYVDAVRNNRAGDLASRCRRIAWEQSALYEALEPYREIELLHSDGSRRKTTALSDVRGNREKICISAPGKPKENNGLPEKKD